MAKRQITSCAACREQRKKCSKECILAPHFPPDDPDKFRVVQKVFGTSYIIKLLQSLESKQRADAVNSLVFEANARVKDPIHGSAGVIHELEKQISELGSQLMAKQEELVNMHSKYDMLGFSPSVGSRDVKDNLYYTDTTEDTFYEELHSLLSKPI